GGNDTPLAPTSDTEPQPGTAPQVAKARSRQGNSTPRPSRWWILPDPVALIFIEQRVARRSPIVPFIPAHRVEQELAIIGAPILVRFAGDDVVRPSGEEARGEQFEP